MTHAEILQKAIEKAIERGWNAPLGARFVRLLQPFEEYVEFTSDHQREYHESVPAIIFNHDFAKALWGEPKNTDYDGRDPGGRRTFGHPVTVGWKYHLQQMVIADDPIEYLGANI